MNKLKIVSVFGILSIIIPSMFIKAVDGKAPDCRPVDSLYLGWAPNFYGSPSIGIWEITWVDRATGKTSEACNTSIVFGPINY